MGADGRRERERAEVRGRIVDAARELFATHGVDAVSMRRVAGAVDYSAASIYLHFPDKAALLREICDNDFDALAASFNRLARGERDPVERIRRVGRAYVRFAVAHPNHYRLMFMTPSELINADGEDCDNAGDPARDGYAFLRHAVGEAVAAGRFRAAVADVELLCQTFWHGVHGVAALSITHARDPFTKWRSLARRTDAMLDILIRGSVVDGDRASGRPAAPGRTRRGAT